MDEHNRIITQNNYVEVRAYIEDRIEHFLVNQESWVLRRFRAFPPDPSENSVDELDQWVATYLPPRVLCDLVARFGTNLTRD
ncbi:MAG: hypothetical protein HUJ31_01105 [Pseudomonadales bacterium]|nr:hypothetical protein [Pseudomonadales bacterium]